MDSFRSTERLKIITEGTGKTPIDVVDRQGRPAATLSAKIEITYTYLPLRHFENQSHITVCSLIHSPFSRLYTSGSVCVLFWPPTTPTPTTSLWFPAEEAEPNMWNGWRDRERSEASFSVGRPQSAASHSPPPPFSSSFAFEAPSLFVLQRGSTILV